MPLSRPFAKGDNPDEEISVTWWVSRLANQAKPDRSQLYKKAWQEWRIQPAGAAAITWTGTIKRSAIIVVPAAGGTGKGGLLTSGYKLTANTLKEARKSKEHDLKFDEFCKG